ncbi:MAG: hypothetical protein JO161_04550 [Planctomycetaceae bacterium]|nr:hypothetical protein [Planctomycetaceae bacterium]
MPTTAALCYAIEAWEAQGWPHDPFLARRRAEGFAIPVFRSQILGLLARVAASASRSTTVPAPHLDLVRQPGTSSSVG